MKTFDYDTSLAILKKYNKEHFHLVHAKTVACVMRALAVQNGFEADKDYWETVGLMHDVDFEMYPDKHCVAAVDILKSEGFSDEFIYSVCSHGYGLCCDTEPKHLMEKTLFACDELTGLIGAAARMRPSKSAKDMDLSSLKKKFKDKKFAAGCSREVITQGAEMLGVSLDALLQSVLDAYSSVEDEINEFSNSL